MFAVAAVLAVCGIALLPFVVGAVHVSGGGDSPAAANHGRDVVQMLYRLLAHPTMLVYPITVAVVLLTGSVLLCASILARKDGRACWQGILLALAAGLGVSSAAHFLITTFAAAKYSYACWACPWCSRSWAVDWHPG